MKKVQEQIDSVRFRSNDFLFQNDEDGSNETEADFPFIPAMLESNDESNSLKRDTRKVKNHKSEDFWFQNYDYSADDLPKKKKSKESEVLFGRYQDQLEQTSPNNQEVDNPETKNLNQEEDYMSELNGLHLNPNQHSDVESFLNQMNDHPKPFTFDIEPLLHSKLSEIQSGTSSQDRKPEDLSPKKYFEFDSEKKKRELPKYQQEVEHIKNDLISEYKNNYINLYKNSIDSDKYKHQLDSMKRQKNDFLDQYYLLNDGRIELDNFLKNPPVDGNGRLINSKDLDLDLKLNKEFQDSEFERDLTFQNSRDQFENQVKPQKSAKKMRSFY